MVGVIDLIHKTQSRVRLITDNRLTVAVRAARGKQQDHFLLEQLNALIFSLEKSTNSTCSHEMQEAISALTRLKAQFIPVDQNMYLAKGELQGTGRPLWRSCGSLLKGTGFNYDFSDKEGPARDLRSGLTYEKDSQAILCCFVKRWRSFNYNGIRWCFPCRSACWGGFQSGYSTRRSVFLSFRSYGNSRKF